MKKTLNLLALLILVIILSCKVQNKIDFLDSFLAVFSLLIIWLLTYYFVLDRE